MKTIDVKKVDIDNLQPYSIYKPEVLKFDNDRILKLLSYYEADKENTMYILNELYNNRELLPKEFCIPDTLVRTEEGYEGFLIKEIKNSIELGDVLESDYFSHEEKIDYLKKIGSILRACDESRKHKNLKKLAIGDVHEANFLVTPKDKKVHVIDLDTARIGSSAVEISKYLSPVSISSYLPWKYNKKSFYTETSAKTDLYCYIIIILNYLAGTNVASFTPEKYAEYMEKLSRAGVLPELIKDFYAIINDSRINNPDYLLDSIDEKTLVKTRIK